MTDLDDRIRGALRPLRESPVPDVPHLRPPAPVPRAMPLGIAGAVGMLVLLIGSLFYASLGGPSPEPRLATRMEALEARIDKVEHEELRLLLSRELALLRRELELSRAK